MSGREVIGGRSDGREKRRPRRRQHVFSASLTVKEGAHLVNLRLLGGEAKVVNEKGVEPQMAQLLLALQRDAKKYVSNSRGTVAECQT